MWIADEGDQRLKQLKCSHERMSAEAAAREKAKAVRRLPRIAYAVAPPVYLQL